jgi:hypothetical protein
MPAKPPTSTSPVWPFLVSQGRSVPHRVVLAPDFMVSKGFASLLRRVTAGTDDLRDVMLSRELTGTPMGNLYVVFRVIVASPAFVGESGNVLTSETSQPILFREGIVCERQVEVSDSLLESAHKAAVSAFSVFWRADDQFAGTIPSAPLPWEATPDGVTLHALAPVAAPESPSGSYVHANRPAPQPAPQDPRGPVGAKPGGEDHTAWRIIFRLFALLKAPFSRQRSGSE